MRAPASTRANDNHERTQGGFSLIELLIVVAIILILAAIAIPNMLKSKMAANQAAAVSNLRIITTASVSYWVTYGNGYPPSLDALGGPASGAATCNGSILIDEILSTAPYQKTGYQYAFSGQGGNVVNVPTGCTAGFQGYLASTAPISVGSTGHISYCSSEPGIIHYDLTGAATATEAACDALPTLQ